jgi:ABC-type phosphate transport system auxiliary subunit
MLLIKLTLDLSVVIGITGAAFLSGLLLRGAQLRKHRTRVGELEAEMVANHAEILELQQERLQLEEKLKDTSNIPVIPINVKEEKKSEKLQDKSAIKK